MQSVNQTFLSELDRVMVQNKPSTRTAQGEQVCFYCGEPFNQRVISRRKTEDHVMPQKLGGANCGFNIVECCTSCNAQKNGSHPLTWLQKNRHNMTDRQLVRYLAIVMYHDLVVLRPSADKVF